MLLVCNRPHSGYLTPHLNIPKAAIAAEVLANSSAAALPNMQFARASAIAHYTCQSALRTVDAHQAGRMKITLADIQSRFDALCGEATSREAIAIFAASAMRADDAGELEMEAEFEEKIWDAIIYLSGVDLKNSPSEYLHCLDDFFQARIELGV